MSRDTVISTMIHRRDALALPSPSHGRRWLAAGTWAPAWLPPGLRRPAFAYAMAGVAAAGAIAVTAGAAYALPSFGFHGMAGFLAVAMVALAWGLGPAALVALVDAVVLSFFVVPPQAGMSGPMPDLGHAIGFVSSLAFGLTVAVIAGRAEARRRQLAEERAELAAILDTAPQALMVWDRAGQLLRANHHAQAHLGAGTERLQAAVLTQRLRHLDGTALRQGELPLTQAVGAREPLLDQQYLFQSAVSGDVPVILNTAPLYDAAGCPSGVLLTLQDIAPIKAFERQREEFWAMVTHDLKNPLTTVCCASQVLQGEVRQLDEADRGRLLRTLVILQSASQRMLGQVTNVLERAREAGGQPTVPRQPTDVLPLLRTLVDESRHETDRHTLELTASVETARCLADPLCLERAFANVLANAIKYSPNGGHITITVSRSAGAQGPWLEVTVRDQGIGIPRANLPHVAEFYYRAENVEGIIAGTGVGLAGARRIVEQHGGSFSLTSTEGEGTTVTIHLPECAAPASIAG